MNSLQPGKRACARAAERGFRQRTLPPSDARKVRCRKSLALALEAHPAEGWRAVWVRKFHKPGWRTGPAHLRGLVGGVWAPIAESSRRILPRFLPVARRDAARCALNCDGSFACVVTNPEHFLSDQRISCFAVTRATGWDPVWSAWAGPGQMDGMPRTNFSAIPTEDANRSHGCMHRGLRVLAIA